jgi:hypothetical protein
MNAIDRENYSTFTMIGLQPYGLKLARHGKIYAAACAVKKPTWAERQSCWLSVSEVEPQQGL